MTNVPRAKASSTSSKTHSAPDVSGEGHPSKTGSSKENALSAYRRGDPSALTLLERVLRDSPNDGELLVNHAAAAAASGATDPFSRIESILVQSPDWIDGQKALARLKTEFGLAKPLKTLEQAIERLPDHPGLWMAYIGLLGAGDQHEMAAEKVAELRKRIGDLPALRVLEARHSGFAGQCDHAQMLLEGLPENVPELHYELARNSLRLGRLDQAAEALDAGLSENPNDVGMLALAEICWRATNSASHRWLLPDDLLIAQVPLDLGETQLDKLALAIAALHTTHSAPLGQSLVGGTQTRGDLRWRQEPEIVDLFAALEDELRSYASRLHSLDERHPLKPLASRAPRITASWSILLESEGFHVSHLHNSGLISSAVHLQVPENLADGEGMLELGRPPSDIPLFIGPFVQFRPLPGHLVLFPSFVYHGTSKFHEGRRLTVAFDAA